MSGKAIGVRILNNLDMKFWLIWVNANGQEQQIGILNELDSEDHNSFVGHVFRVRSMGNTLVTEHRVTGATDETIIVKYCDDLATEKKQSEVLFPADREAEFNALVDTKPFTCEGPSSQWSCVRALSKEAIASRDKSLYGFSQAESRGQRKVHDTIDDSYTSHIPLIPKLSTGFLKMNMTDKIREALLPFYAREENNARKHEPIGGDYSNIHRVGMTKVDLDAFQHVRQEVVQDMQQILQWWTQRRLKHTSTFGIRIYKRESMLINHVDRADTHLASAVLQVAQEGVDEGWPLEVILDDGTTLEVYLQPGEMVLYEGARLFHGRPMRFQGEKFANVFSHFAPSEWIAVGKPWNDPLRPEQEEVQPTHGDYTPHIHTEL